MKKRILSAFLAGAILLTCTTSCKTRNVIKTNGTAEILSLKVDYLKNPVGIDSTAPLFSWNMSDSKRGQKQTAYQITVANSYEALMHGDYNMWDSGKVESDVSIAIPYAGSALAPSTRYYWQVQVWDKDGLNTVSSGKNFFETGVMANGFADAKWIAAAKSGGITGGAPILRKEFKLDQAPNKIASARVYATCVGLYELELNGKKVGDDFLNPGNSQYTETVQYQTFDITEQLKKGTNELAATLGRGWWCGWAGMVYLKEFPAFICKTVITYSDGSKQTIVTNEDWEYTTNGPITENDIYNGEIYVATRADKSKYKYNPVKVVTAEEMGVGEITSQICGTIKCLQEVEPINVTEPESGKYIYDFGQNLAGVIEITVKAEENTKVVIRHAEVLNSGELNGDGPVGTLYTANLRGAQATDTYVCAGTGNETWHPVFTFHGFRYAEISGIAKEDIVSVKALVLYSEMADSSTFETSNAKVNKLERNTYWGMRSNFLSVPTDCPQRDERYGYLGDAQIFCGTSMYYMDTAAFYNKYINDILDCTLYSGTFPNSAPGGYKDSDYQARGGWTDGGMIIPYTAYKRYGDITMLEECYPYMQGYIEYMKREAGSDFIRDNMGEYGDWLNFNDPTPVGTVDTAYCAYSATIMAECAEILGKTEDAATYYELAQNYKNAWVSRYMNFDGSTKCNSQTSYVLALAFDICPENLKAACAQKLVDKIKSNGNKLTVGFAGVTYLLPVLCDNGHANVAYDLLLQEDCPSWFYMINKGATTVWEHWDGISIINMFQSTSMNSFNHFAFGAVMEWGYGYLAGIKCDRSSTAFKHFTLQPTVGGDITYAKASYDSMYGTIKSEWQKNGDKLNYICTVPANTTATLYLPASAIANVTEGGKALSEAEGISNVREENGKVVMELVSGSYSFTVQMN